MPYVTINLNDKRVEQVRDTYVKALQAARGDDCLIALEHEVPEGVHSGHSIEFKVIFLEPTCEFCP